MASTDNIRQAKRRELLERRHTDLAALDQRLTLVPDLALLGALVEAEIPSSRAI